ncbi:MAG: alkaline phosphatase D family protein [Deltaproteobacteria bacterium]|nr:alkaline phosphatase D family protein [Nannocystaceae bacterium]
MIDRRSFLLLAASGAATTLIGCGDDSPAGDGTSSSETGELTTSTTGTDGPASSGGIDATTDSGASESGSESTDTGEPAACLEAPSELGFVPDAIAQDDALFPSAVMAGEMKPTSFMVAGYVDDRSPKRLLVWRAGEAQDSVVVAYDVEVDPTDDGFVKVTIDGLCPGTWYRYALFAGPQDGPVGRSWIGECRTALADDVLEPLVLAVAACNGDANGSFGWPALDAMSDEYYDMFLHLGDQAYNDGAFTRDQYRTSWRQYLQAEGYKRAYSRAGMYATWDDHEVEDNGNFDRETMDPMQLEKRQNALDAYFEVLPIEAEGPNYRLWRSFRWGLTAEIIVLDCRYERRPSAGTYISAEQMAFLQERLLASPCHFKVVMNSVPITNMPGIWDLAANDRWEGYAASRNALLQFIDENDIPNVWFLSGDFHVCFVSRLEPSGTTRSSQIREIAVSTGNTNVLGDLLGPPQYEFASSAAHGLIVTLDPEANAVNVRFIDPTTGDDAYNASLVDTP